MPEESGIDGSQLEQTVAEPSVQDQNPEGQIAEQTPQSQEQPTEQPQPVIPDKYQGKSVEEVIEMHRESEKALGRYKQEIGEYRQYLANAQFQQPQQGSNPANQNQQLPSSLPGEAKGQEVDLNELAFERPADAFRQVAQSVLDNHLKQQQVLVQQSQDQRTRAIEQVEQHELRSIQLDDPSFTPQRYAIMQDIARKDPEIAQIISNPNLSAQDVQNATRKLHDKAKAFEDQQFEDRLKSKNLDPQTIAAFKEAQKIQAANGTPRTGVQPSGSSQPNDETVKLLNERGWGHIFTQ